MNQTQQTLHRLVNSHTGYDVTSYFRSAFIEFGKMAENVAFDGFGSNFCGAVFFACPTNWLASFSK